MKKTRVFLDTSALFAAIWSDRGGARLILKLGEVGAVEILVSSRVLEEIEGAMRRKASDLLPRLALLLEKSNLEVIPDSIISSQHSASRDVDHPGDAVIIDTAAAAAVDYFVTLDKQHFLENDPLEEALPFPLGTPGDLISWYRSILA